MDLDNLDIAISTKQVTVLDAKPGVLLDEDCNIIFKTEYSDKQEQELYFPICYNEAGERWHGDYNKLVRNLYVE